MYSIKCINNTWSKKWLRNGFKTSVGKDVLNKEIIMEILKIKEEIKQKKINISFKHIFSHQPPPQDIESNEYKFWYFNNLVDSNITKLLQFENEKRKKINEYRQNILKHTHNEKIICLKKESKITIDESKNKKMYFNKEDLCYQFVYKLESENYTFYHQG